MPGRKRAIKIIVHMDILWRHQSEGKFTWVAYGDVELKYSDSGSCSSNAGGDCCPSSDCENNDDSVLDEKKRKM